MVSSPESVLKALVGTPMLRIALSMIRVLWEPGTPASIETDARRNLIPRESQLEKAGGSGSEPLPRRFTLLESLTICHLGLHHEDRHEHGDDQEETDPEGGQIRPLKLFLSPAVVFRQAVPLVHGEPLSSRRQCDALGAGRTALLLRR